MIEIGRLCIKVCGRDAGGTCAIVDILDNNYVLIDGNVRRKKCNILHLEPTSKKIDIKKGASHETVKKAFEKLKLPVWETKPKEKRERPRKIRGKKKIAEEAEKKPEKEKKIKKKEKKAEIKKLPKTEEGLEKSKTFQKEEKPAAKEKEEKEIKPSEK